MRGEPVDAHGNVKPGCRDVTFARLNDGASVYVKTGSFSACSPEQAPSTPQAVPEVLSVTLLGASTGKPYPESTASGNRPVLKHSKRTDRGAGERQSPRQILQYMDSQECAPYVRLNRCLFTAMSFLT
jgi:hypothetical protein